MTESTELSLQSSRVLLVDDSGPIQRLMSHHLGRAGVSVATAVDGREGVALALRNMARGACFDLILMDLEMPRMDGYQALRRLRQRGFTGPVVALTTHSLPADLQRCRQAGFDEYAHKPIDLPKLQAIIVHFMRKKRLAADGH